MGQKAQQIAVSRLKVPTLWDKRELSVEVDGPDSYTVSKDGNELFKGKVGQFEQHGDVTMLVNSIEADAGTRFTVSKLSNLQAIKMISNNLVVADMGKDTGVLGLTYSGEDPVQISRVLDQVINNYLYQNIARKSEEAEKAFSFLLNNCRMYAPSWIRLKINSTFSAVSMTRSICHWKQNLPLILRSAFRHS